LLLAGDYSILSIIEAKHFLKDEEKGRIQARSRKILKSKLIRVPFFLTNGRVWRFVDEDEIERKVSCPFSQEDLNRKGDLRGKMRNPCDVQVDLHIVDRPRSVKIVRELSEHFSEGH
jgi:type I restriction enzyme R subunit